MWLTRPAYDDLVLARVKAEAVRDDLRRQNDTLNAHIEWLRVRTTQLELERAQLLKRYMNLDVPVPSFESEAPSFHPSETMSFEDIGDIEAARLGIGFNPDGTLAHGIPTGKTHA